MRQDAEATDRYLDLLKRVLTRYDLGDDYYSIKRGSPPFGRFVGRFEEFLRRYGLDDPALGELALIVRGADTARLDLAPQAAGLLALSLGLSALFKDGHEMLRHGMVVYDALYAWLREARDETHGWPPMS